MRKVLITSSGIKITLESNPENSSDNFNSLVKAIEEHLEAKEEEEFINQDVLFETKLINTQRTSLYTESKEFDFNKTLMS